MQNLQMNLCCSKVVSQSEYYPTEVNSNDSVEYYKIIIMTGGKMKVLGVSQMEFKLD